LCCKFAALAEAMSEGPSHSIVIRKRKHTSYNIHVKLGTRHCKKRGEHEIHIACVVQIPDMMIHTILKIAHGIETRALNLLKHLNLKITHQKCDVMEIFDRFFVSY
jgi:hypothetical protein